MEGRQPGSFPQAQCTVVLVAQAKKNREREHLDMVIQLLPRFQATEASGMRINTVSRCKT